LAEKIAEAMAVEVKLIELSGGVFEVVVDDRLVYSKKQTDEFPDETQLVKKIRGGVGA